jgi:rhomboid protease GluP
MSASHPESISEVSYAVDYQLTGSIEYNTALKGSGTLTIKRDGPRYLFAGQQRAMFSAQPMEVVFRAEDIWNVVARGRKIYFTTQHPEVKSSGKPFIFFCADEREAAEIASMLPERLDASFTAEREFVTQLHALHTPRGLFGSVTNVLIAMNVVAFVIMGFLGAGWFNVESLTPYMLYAANHGAATTDGEWWRLLTSMFVHYGLLHLSLNLWALYQAGHFLETLQGRALYALTYLGAGLAGGFASLLWNGDKTWSAGASGAVFGVYGAILGYMLREKQSVPRTLFQSLMKSSLMFAVINIAWGLSHSGIDNAAHLGGFGGGFILGWLIALPIDAAGRARKRIPHLFAGSAVIVALVVVGVMTTPRFNYSVREELAVEAVDRKFAPRQQELFKQHTAALQRIRDGEDGRAHAAWVEQTLIPFYENWIRELTPLPLKNGRVSAVRRDMSVRYYRALLTSFHHLSAGLNARDPRALTNYLEEYHHADDEIEQFNQK